ncbi:SRPBCC domain-containing protein [Mucilaginibacter sp. Mucisp86]|uniref:SRPBCC domain-containing protein n=1 Tax=Mucilaginibacter sp. Mucisp86 TaxID=3243060 RepID=UPI0039B4776C
METLELNTIRKEIIVSAAQQTAFEVFVNQMGLWWPASGHTDDCPMIRVGLEPKTGGRWLGYNRDGDESELGKVLVFDPYALFALDWQTDADLRFDPDLHTEVRVEFIPEGDKQTRVKLTHFNVERLGEAARGINEGWSGIMEVYQNFITNSFSTSINITISPEAALQKISEVANWWGVNFEGSAAKQGDHFVIKMGPEAWFNYTVVELVPGKKVVWHVDDCYMPWYEDKTEWKGQDMVFEINDNTLTFTHVGLVAGIACFKDCVPGWTHWITRSLKSYLETGKGDFKQR